MTYLKGQNKKSNALQPVQYTKFQVLGETHRHTDIANYWLNRRRGLFKEKYGLS